MTFPYYGSKASTIKYYPLPVHDTIIEPFAGSARYALRYWERDVILIDAYPVIITIWQWLQQASVKDVLSLPRLKEGERASDYKFDCEGQRALIGFLAASWIATPQDTHSSRSEKDNKNNSIFKSIAANLHKIRHWKFINGDYRCLANIKATYFVDPPYAFGGEHYKVSNKHLDYAKLAAWCQSRNGQTIVCENTKADWLPFQPIRSLRGSVHNTVEAMWTNGSNDRAGQAHLFTPANSAPEYSQLEIGD